MIVVTASSRFWSYALANVPTFQKAGSQAVAHNAKSAMRGIVVSLVFGSLLNLALAFLFIAIAAQLIALAWGHDCNSKEKKNVEPVKVRNSAM